MDNQSRGDKSRGDPISVLLRYGARVGKTLTFIILLWILIAFSTNGIGGAHKAASRVLALITGTDDPLGAEREQGISAKKEPADPSIDTMATGTTADQMAVQWSYFVTGKPSSAGFLLVSGSGETGASCNAGDGLHLLQFGNEESDLKIPDYIGASSRIDSTAVAGAFWFNSRNNTLKTLNTSIMDLNPSKKETAGRDLEDGILQVESVVPGVVLVNGVRYHLCQL